MRPAANTHASEWLILVGGVLDDMARVHLACCRNVWHTGSCGYTIVCLKISPSLVLHIGWAQAAVAAVNKTLLCEASMANQASHHSPMPTIHQTNAAIDSKGR